MNEMPRSLVGQSKPALQGTIGKVQRRVESTKRRTVVSAGNNTASEDENASPSRIDKILGRYDTNPSAVPVLFTLIDSNHTYQEVNEAYCQAHGKSRAEIVGRKVAEVWGEEVFQATIRDPLKRCLAGQEVHYQARFEFPSTGVRHFDVSFFPYSQNGSVTHAIVVTRDITNSRRAEEALRESEARYRMLIETAKDVIFHLARDGRIQSVNQAFEAITGWPCEEWLGKPFAPLLHPEDRPTALSRFEAVLSGEAPSHHTYRVRKKSGEYTVGEFTLSAEIKNGAAVGVFGIARDVTERQRTEEALRQSEEHYRELFHQAYRMQENLRHLSNKILEVQEQERTRISRELHDEVGQALTAISVNLAVLKREVAPDNERFLKKIADSQALLSETMGTVHGFARELRPALLDDLGLLAALRSYVKAFAERTGIRIHFRASAAAHIEALDISQKTVIYRVAQESLNNTAKHAGAKRVTFTLRKRQHRILVEIMDDGKGFNTDQRFSGKIPSRLGLLGMQERVRLINGDFSVESEPGQGTLIRVEIPLKS